MPFLGCTEIPAEVLGSSCCPQVPSVWQAGLPSRPGIAPLIFIIAFINMFSKYFPAHHLDHLSSSASLVQVFAADRKPFHKSCINCQTRGCPNQLTVRGMHRLDFFNDNSLSKISVHTTYRAKSYLSKICLSAQDQRAGGLLLL